ncbi:retrotransposon gag domain, Retroviral aspartyl protease [Senna tora]|uniref:Retrotransposon gag domain, Retroviral aspartyl protease n=1 Tax=Senna tora TaxID=362788 RepID=A0A834XC76_9FABA|nr:retrotransposon gag domain, Retroviral aspartyl protease [Senna tora]
MVTNRNSASHDPPSIPQNPPSIPQHPEIPQTPENPPIPHQDAILQHLPHLSTRLDEMDVTIKQQNKYESSKGKEISGSKGSYWGDDCDEEHDVSWWMKSATRRPHTKMEFPKFEGGDPRGWILKAKKYFRYYQTPDELKVDIAAMYLEGDALDLFAWINTEHTILYWEELQLGSVQEYRQEFAKHATKVKNWPKHCLLQLFLRGLKPELKADVRVHKPRSVYKAMSLALEFEQKPALVKGPKPSTWPNISNPTSSSNYTPRANLPNKQQQIARDTPQSSQPSSLQQTQQARTNSRPWETERQQRISKGLCFLCNERFAPGHRCKTTSLTLMEIDDAGNPIDETATELDSNEQAEEAEVTFHAILGNTISTTMKWNGTLGSHKVLILVDSGYTHNFISSQFVNKLQLPTQKVSPFGVQIGNSEIIKYDSVCENLKIEIQGLQIIQDFYPFSMSGADVVLGIRWLASLNTVRANWNEMFLIFNLNGKQCKLQGVVNRSHATPFQYLSKESEITVGTTPLYLQKGTTAALFKNYGQIARPLTDLTKKNAFHWSPAAKSAFNTLKQALTIVPVLQMPNFSTTFTVECDASSDGVGAILLQSEHPIAYFKMETLPSGEALLCSD